MSIFTVEQNNFCIVERVKSISDEREREYTFYKIETQDGRSYYAIEAFDGEEGDMQMLGTQYERSHESYRRIAEAKTSVISLREVVRDILCEEIY